MSVISKLPEIIHAAAASPLGIVALMVIALSFIAYRFFRGASERWKFGTLLLLFVGCALFVGTVVRTAKDSAQVELVSSAAAKVGLESSLSKWIEEAEKAKKARTIAPGRPMPEVLLTSRGAFESAWRAAALEDRKRLNSESVYKGLSYASGVYRIQEHDSSTQSNANFWADEAIRYFEEIQDPTRLTEALLDKAAIYLDLAQLGHDDKVQFDGMARAGDAVMTKAFQTANPSQKPQVLRLASRFYYNLARPKSFRLSDNWDNNYLLLSYEKASAAYQLDPNDSKSAGQLARAAIKASKNPPQNRDPQWTRKLRQAQQILKAAWNSSQSERTTVDQRLSPLNVLGVTTIETVAREWGDLQPGMRGDRAARYLEEIEQDGLGPLREALALLGNSELRKGYDFDLHYDLARGHCVRTALVRAVQPARAKDAFGDAEANLSLAREGATVPQLDAALKDVDREITFRMLTTPERQRLAAILHATMPAARSDVSSPR
jgi:hypothetical protein